MDWFDDWALTLAVFIPLVGMALVLLIPKAQEQAVKVTALLAALATLGVGIGILAGFDYDQAGRLQFQVNEPWIEVIHSRYHIGIDGISLPLLILSMLIVPLCVIYSWDHFPEPHNPKAFLALILLLETGMLGTFVAEDLILFFIFFEVVLLPMFFMIGVWGGPNREYASIKFFLFTLFGSALMLVSFLAMFFLSKVQTFDMVTLSQLHGAGIAKATQMLVFAGLFLGFAIKVPMFPFHTWLPDAHTEAPTVGSVLLAAVMLKLGTYGFIRIALPMLPKAARVWAPWIGLLAVIGIIYGALCCLAQTRHEAPDRVLVGRPHGLRDARHRDAHRLRSQRRDLRHGRPRLHHRHAVLRRRVGAGALRDPRDEPPRRAAHPGAEAGLDPRVLRDGVARSSRPRRVLGRVPRRPVRLRAREARRRAVRRHRRNLLTYRTYMVIAAIGTVLAAGYLLWMLQRVAFGRPKPEFEDAHIHDVHVPEWIALGARCSSSSSCSASTPTSSSTSPNGPPRNVAQSLRGRVTTCPS